MILRRIEGSRFSEVVAAWPDAKVVIIGGGPSLTKEQVALVKKAHLAGKVKCIAVNDAFLLAPWADVDYAADAHWHRWMCEGVARPGMSAPEVSGRWTSFAGEKCTIECSGATVADDKVHMLKNAGEKGISTDPRALITGRNSGFQSLNLAVLAGAKKIVLIGFDGQPDKEGRSHWFGEHKRPTPPAAYPYYRQAMSAAENTLEAMGIEVLNASPGSAIDSFPKIVLEAAL